MGRILADPELRSRANQLSEQPALGGEILAAIDSSSTTVFGFDFELTLRTAGPQHTLLAITATPDQVRNPLLHESLSRWHQVRLSRLATATGLSSGHGMVVIPLDGLSDAPPPSQRRRRRATSTP